MVKIQLLLLGLFLPSFVTADSKNQGEYSACWFPTSRTIAVNEDICIEHIAVIIGVLIFLLLVFIGLYWWYLREKRKEDEMIYYKRLELKAEAAKKEAMRTEEYKSS